MGWYFAIANSYFSWLRDKPKLHWDLLAWATGLAAVGSFIAGWIIFLLPPPQKP